MRPDEETNPMRQWKRGSRVYHGNYGYGLVADPCDADGWVLVEFNGRGIIKCAHALLTPDLSTQKQDDFLRTLLAVVSINRNSGTPDYGLRLIAQKIEERLPQLKPICYEGLDLSCGLSGDGIHHICGDKKSIDRVKRALHEHSNVESFWRPAYQQMQAQLAKAVVTYEIEVKARDSDEWTRQAHESWQSHTKEEAIDSAWRIRAVAKRQTRVVKVTTIIDEEIVDEPAT